MDAPVTSDPRAEAERLLADRSNLDNPLMIGHFVRLLRALLDAPAQPEVERDKEYICAVCGHEQVAEPAEEGQNRPKKESV